MLANCEVFRIIRVISAVYLEQFISSTRESPFESCAVPAALFHTIFNEDWYLLPFLSSEYSPCLDKSEESEEIIAELEAPQALMHNAYSNNTYLFIIC